MARIAFIQDAGLISWQSLILMLAAAGTVFLFLGLYLHAGEPVPAGFLTVPLAVEASLLLSRLIHWYCFPGNYESLTAAVTELRSGGFALAGVFLGCIGAAVATRLLGLHRNLPRMLDCMSLAGAAGIAVGRLASLFDASDRGQILQTVRTMPWAYPVVNAISGATEYRLATFLLQAMVSGLLFAGLCSCLLAGKRFRRKDGDIALLFALVYSASQVILDSTRYDSIYFRSNGFVSIVQVLSAVTLAGVIGVFSVRLVRGRGFRKWYLLLWAAIGALIGVAGYMEYHVQRHGNEALFAYSVMGGSLALAAALTLVIWHLGTREEKTALKSE